MYTIQSINMFVHEEFLVVFCYFCITLYTATKTITDFNENVLKWISVQLHIKPTPKLGKLEKSKC